MKEGECAGEPLRRFRRSFYGCMERRRDALFELTDAILSAGSVPSPAHLSLSLVHRRGWGSLYAALSKGWIQEEALRDLLADLPLADKPDRARVYAVDRITLCCNERHSYQLGGKNRNGRTNDFQ